MDIKISYLLNDYKNIFYRDTIYINDDCVKILDLLLKIKKEIRNREACYINKNISSESIFNQSTIYYQNKHLYKPCFEINYDYVSTTFIKILDMKSNKIFIDKDILNNVISNAVSGINSFPYLMITALCYQLENI